MRGKLVPQDPNDEPASELLKRIATEKARLVKAGESRKPSAIEPISHAEAPFALPSAWAWARDWRHLRLSTQAAKRDPKELAFKTAGYWNLKTSRKALQRSLSGCA